MNLFLFPPGARGDFLASILFGDQLKADGTKAMITRTGFHPSRVAKIHKFGQSEWANVVVTESDLHLYQTFRVDLSSPLDQWQATWLLFNKKLPRQGVMDEKTLRRHQTVMHNWQQYYSQYDDQIQFVVPFAKLFDIDYISELYQTVCNRCLSDDAIARISNNIGLNMDIINQNPFVCPQLLQSK